MKYFVLTILLVVSLSAQLDTEEYIKRLAETDGTEHVDLLIKIGEIKRDLSKSDEAIDYAEKALSKAQEIDYKSGEINALNILASAYLLSQQLEEGIEFTRKALNLSVAEGYKYGIAYAYRNIGIYQIYNNHPDLSVDTLQAAVKIFTEIKDTVGMAASLTGLGVANTRLNNIQKSIALFQEAAELYSIKGNNYLAAHSYLNLGSIYSTIIGDYKQALTYTLESLKNFQKVGDEFKAAYAMLVIGTIYEQLGDYDTPINYYTQALKEFEQSGNTYLIANAVNNLGEVYKERREFDKAIEFYMRSLNESKKINNAEGKAVALNNIGECYLELGNYDLALDYFNQSYAGLEEINDAHKMSISLNNQAAALVELNNYQKAIIKAKTAIKLAEEVSSREEMQKGLEILFSANKKLGKYKDALDYYLRFETIKDSLLSEKRSSQLERILAEHKEAQSQAEIELLTKNAALQQAELDRQEILTYFLIAISTMLLIFGVIYFTRYTERKKMNKKLIESTNELNELNKTKDLFFSIIAHDLRGPFNSLLGITEILAEDTKELSETEIKNLSTEVNQNARNVFLLLENLLEWASTQLGKINFEPENFDLNKVVTRNINLYQKAASIKKIDMVMNLGNEVAVYGDKNMIDSVTRNLINNAVKFTGEGGIVKVDTQRENGGEIWRNMERDRERKISGIYFSER